MPLSYHELIPSTSSYGLPWCRCWIWWDLLRYVAESLFATAQSAWMSDMASNFVSGNMTEKQEKANWFLPPVLSGDAFHSEFVVSAFSLTRHTRSNTAQLVPFESDRTALQQIPGLQLKSAINSRNSPRSLTTSATPTVPILRPRKSAPLPSAKCQPRIRHHPSWSLKDCRMSSRTWYSAMA